MKITDELLEKLQTLSRLRLGNIEKEKISADLESIIEMFDKLSEVDTTDVEPLRYIADNQNQFRADIVHGELSISQALSNVPEVEGTSISVPKFLNPK